MCIALRNGLRWTFRTFSEPKMLLRRCTQKAIADEGASMVEMALSLVLVLLPMLFGIIILSLAIYTYLYVADAAREGTRYAIVRGSSSCTILSTFSNCGLSVGNVTSNTDSTKNPVFAYIKTLKYPGLDPSKFDVGVTWWYATVTNPGGGAYSSTSWTTQCTSDTAVAADPCNKPGNAVQVVVKYNFPLSIPFWRSTTLTVQSQSKMVINE